MLWRRPALALLPVPPGAAPASPVAIAAPATVAAVACWAAAGVGVAVFEFVAEAARPSVLGLALVVVVIAGVAAAVSGRKAGVRHAAILLLGLAL